MKLQELVLFWLSRDPKDTSYHVDQTAASRDVAQQPGKVIFKVKRLRLTRRRARRRRISPSLITLWTTRITIRRLIAHRSSPFSGCELNSGAHLDAQYY